jgi:hypothetical protein
MLSGLFVEHELDPFTALVAEGEVEYMAVGELSAH